jgi:uncharacterized protein YjiS (DUF1127 family)
MTTLIENCDETVAQEILRKQGILKQVLLEWLQVLELKFRIYRERQQLRVMSDLMLKDIGITRAQADTEALSSQVPVERLIALEKVDC